MPSSMWHLVDARGQVVGRLASQLVHILRGKHKPIYAPHMKNVGDYVVVINAKYVHFTGNTDYLFPSSLLKVMHNPHISSLL